MKLTAKQEKFAQEFILKGIASEAYRIAYPTSLKWPDRTVHSKASLLLSNGKVLARVEELRNELKVKFDISAERLLLEQSRIALFDFRRLFDADGKLINPEDFPDDAAAAVSSVKVSRQRLVGAEGDEPRKEEIVELKLWNKNTALESLFKNKGLYAQDNAQVGASMADALRELDKRG